MNIGRSIIYGLYIYITKLFQATYFPSRPTSLRTSRSRHIGPTDNKNKCIFCLARRVAKVYISNTKLISPDPEKHPSTARNLRQVYIWVNLFQRQAKALLKEDTSSEAEANVNLKNISATFFALQFNVSDCSLLYIIHRNVFSDQIFVGSDVY